MVRIKLMINISIVSHPLLSSKFIRVFDYNTGLIRTSSSTSDSPTVQIKDADCLPRGYTTEFKKFDRTITVTGEGDFASCTKHLITLLNLNAVCLKKPCSFNGVYQPEINYNSQDFYGFSEFWYTMQGLIT